MADSSNNKEIVISEHCRERMVQRRVKESHVISTIREPHTVGAGNTDYTKSFERDFPPKRLTVIAEELEDSFIVITVYWEMSNNPQLRDGFDLSLHVREDGSLETAYIQLLDGEAVRTEQIIKNVLMIDFNEHEQIRGIEILAPVAKESVLKIADRMEAGVRGRFTSYLEKWAPAAMLKSA